MNKSSRILSYILALVLITGLFTGCKKSSGLRAVVIGDQKVVQNGAIKAILENTGVFDVKFKNTPPGKKADADLVVLADEKYTWDEATREAFKNYVKSGGGVILLNRAANAFDGWSDFEEISGIPSSNEHSNAAFTYRIKNVAKDHPILKGLQANWMHVEDQMMFNTNSVAGKPEVLSVAMADSAHGGIGREIPVVLANKYGEGRIFSTTLGAGASAENAEPLHDVGFITLVQRGAEWAATGVVSQEAPIDFPNYASTHTWPDFKPLSLDELFQKASTYEIGKSRKYLFDISSRIRNCDGKTETYEMYESKILDFLNSEASVASKQYFCKELSWMGSEKAIPTLEKLVNDKDLKDAAQYALFRLNN